jgi:hypothetical protein
VYDSARRTADAGRSDGPATRDSAGAGPGRGEVDLSNYGSGRRAGVPALASSSDGVRPAPDARAGPRSNPPVRTQPLTRESLLERYRAPKTSPADIARARERSDKGLSRARGATADGKTGAKESTRGREQASVSKELRKQQYESTTKRLARLDKKDPVRAKQVMRAGEAVAVASDKALRVAMGVGFAACGSSADNCWWDPCNNGFCDPATTCWNACGPYSYWWWNGCTYWLPSWGFGWGWGGCWGNWCFGWNSHPYYCYPGYAYYGCSPWWYAGAIYSDGYYDEPAQVVVVHEYEQQPEAAPEAAPPEAAPANLPPEKRDPALAQALVRSAQQYVALGDLAFSERRFGDAVSHYAKAIEYAPGDAVLYMLLSDALFATGDYHYSASALRKSLELEPRLVDTIVDKHAVYTNPEDFEKQLGYLETYVKDNFLDEDARLVLAANYLFGNKPHQAYDFLQSSFSLNVRQSPTGALIYQRSQKLAAENPFSK